MTNKSKAQNQYLRLMSKLYDMASQFDVAELSLILKIAEDEENKPVIRATQALLMLVRRDDRAERNSARKDLIPHVRQVKSASPMTAGSNFSRYPSSLQEVFASKEIFPTVNDVVSLLPFPFEIKAKESRDRFSRRLVGHINELPEMDRKETLENLQGFLSNQSGGGFISNWSRLIRGL